MYPMRKLHVTEKRKATKCFDSVRRFQRAMRLYKASIAYAHFINERL